MSRFTLHHGDSREILHELAEHSVDAIVCDPPYELTSARPGGRSEATRGAVMGGFMGMRWDATGIAHDATFWAECLRVAKPGAWLAAFGGTRTFHRLACAIEDAGWELRDSPVRGHMHQPQDCPWLHGWMFGSGFPKSHNGEWGGIALKPAWEPIVLARKPLIGTVEANWREHSTGGLNIDGCRVQSEGGDYLRRDDAEPERIEGVAGYSVVNRGGGSELGRWPANLLHDGSDEVLACFPDTASGEGAVKRASSADGHGNAGAAYGAGSRAAGTPMVSYGDAGSAARFFYCAKASQEDRDEGIRTAAKLFGMSGAAAAAAAAARGEHYDNGDGGVNRTTLRRNIHPTVKPTDLMRWLVRLVTPAGGLVLDPFMGSGSTGKAAMLEGMRFVGIDLTAEYVDIARARIEFALLQGHQPSLLAFAEEA